MANGSGFRMSVSLLSKLASVVVHAQEWTSDDAHPADLEALKRVIEDREVVEWLTTLGPLAPVRRKGA